MIILGIDTASRQASCAFGGVEGVMASVELARGPGHVESLAPAISWLSERSGIALREVSAIAVDVGPGLFTGLRVGISTGKALAQALRVPMIGLSSLDLLAFPLRWCGRERLVVSALDARRGEVYAALYRPAPGGVQRVSEPALYEPDELSSELQAQGDPCIAVGDGAVRHAAVLRDPGHVEVSTSHQFPTAASLVELAHPIAIREEFVSPSELRPFYMRRPDAEVAWDAKRAEGRV